MTYSPATPDMDPESVAEVLADLISDESWCGDVTMVDQNMRTSTGYFFDADVKGRAMTIQVTWANDS